MHILPPEQKVEVFPALNYKCLGKNYIYLEKLDDYIPIIYITSKSLLKVFSGQKTNFGLLAKGGFSGGELLMTTGTMAAYLSSKSASLGHGRYCTADLFWAKCREQVLGTLAAGPGPAGAHGAQSQAP